MKLIDNINNNLFFEKDNLDVLKLLQEAHLNNELKNKVGTHG